MTALSPTRLVSRVLLRSLAVAVAGIAMRVRRMAETLRHRREAAALGGFNDRMLADVQAWVDGSKENLGWILIGEEWITDAQKVVRPDNGKLANASCKIDFYSSETAAPFYSPPTLTVTYVPEPSCLTLLVGGALVLLWRPVDPYPFILLNLVLSCLAAIQAPIIMMSQNRQEAKDRLRACHDYQVNLKAELEIRQLHEKIDHLLSHQWERLVEIQEVQLELLSEIGKR